MKYTVKWKISDTIIVEATGDTVAEVHESLSHLVEVYGSETMCGICKNKQLIPISREAQGNKFYEIGCLKPGCYARFALGQHKKVKGSLFPQRKNKDGTKKSNNGWSKWEPQKENANVKTN